MKVQIGYVDFEGQGFSAGGVYFGDFRHGDSDARVKEMWLVDDEFVAVTDSGAEIVINKTTARCWTPLENISWLRGEQHKDVKEQRELSRARKAAGKK